MMKREMKFVIGDELQTLFHPIVNATKQAAEETRKELEPMKKKLADINGALKASIDGAYNPVKILILPSIYTGEEMDNCRWELK